MNMFRLTLVALIAAIIMPTMASGAIISDSTASEVGGGAVTPGWNSSTEFYGVKESGTTIAGLVAPNNTFDFDGTDEASIPNGAVMGRVLGSSGARRQPSWEYQITTTAAQAFIASSIQFSGTIINGGQPKTDASDYVGFELFINDEAASDLVEFRGSGNNTWMTVVTAGNDGNSGTVNGTNYNANGIHFTLSLTQTQIDALAGTDITKVTIKGSQGGMSGGVEGFATGGTLSANTIPEPASMMLLAIGGVMMARRR